jgi:hypothetical protein
MHSVSQIKKDARALYGGLLSAFQNDLGRIILIKTMIQQGNIHSWYQLVY